MALHGQMRSCIDSNDASTHHRAQGGSDNAAMHEATREVIRSQLKAKGLSQRQLALMAGMSQSTLNRFMNQATDSLEFAHIMAIARALSMTVSELIGETPILEDAKIRSVALAMKQMPEYKKDALVAASNSLAQQDEAPRRRQQQ